MSVPTIQCDAMLLSWQETHSGGAKIVLQLASPDDLDPFKRLTVKKGRVAGQLLTCVFVEVDGNGQPIEPEPEPPKKRGGGKFPGGYCGLAVRWCAEPNFAVWLSREFPSESEECGPSTYDEFCVRMLRLICGIKSRKELDTDATAGERFNERIRAPYAAYRKGIGLDD